MSMKGVTVVGILGRSFCGSSYLSRLFGLVPGVVVGGEMHWLLDKRPEKVDQMAKCAICGDACPYFTEAFRNSGLTDATLYERVLRQVNPEAKALISSDKFPGRYMRFTKTHEMGGIVMIRSPEGMIASDLRRGLRALEEAMDSYVHWYLNLETWAKWWCNRWAIVDYEMLAAEPTRMLRSILTHCYLCPTWDEVRVPNDLSGLKVHQVGGNVRGWPEQSLVHRSDNWIDERWKTELTQKQLEAIRGNSALQYLYQRLKQKALEPHEGRW